MGFYTDQIPKPQHCYIYLDAVKGGGVALHYSRYPQLRTVQQLLCRRARGFPPL